MFGHFTLCMKGLITFSLATEELLSHKQNFDTTRVLFAHLSFSVIFLALTLPLGILLHIKQYFA